MYGPPTDQNETGTKDNTIKSRGKRPLDRKKLCVNLEAEDNTCKADAR